MKWIQCLGSKAKTPLQVAQEAKPIWKGILGVDGKWIKIAGADRCILVGLDLATRDIPNFEYAESENSLDYRIFYLTLKEMNYPARGFVMDRQRDSIKWARKIYPNVPIQFCCAHFIREVDQKLHYLLALIKLRACKNNEQYQKRVKQYKLRLELRKKVYNILFAKTESLARKRLQSLVKCGHRFTKPYMQKIIVTLIKDGDGFFAHFKVNGLPRSNNLTELLVNQIEARIKLIEGFQSDETAENFIGLFIHYLRFKTFTYCKKKNKKKNGKFPLQIAKSNLKTKDWLRFSQKH